MTVRKAIALLLVLAILAAGGYYLLKTERDDSERMRNLYTEVEPLERERESLLQKRKDIESEYALKTRDYGTVEIMFKTLELQIYTDVWPVMRTREVVGVLPLSFTELPGKYNKLTPEMVKALVADGWGTCAFYENSTDGFSSWYTQFDKALSALDLAMPTTIYFGNNDYDPSMDDALIAAGFRIVILNASDGRSETVTDVRAPLWVTGAMPWGYTGSTTDLELLGRTDGANLVLIMDLTETWDPAKNRNIESQEKKNFVEVLDSWKEYLYKENPLDKLEQVGPTPNIYVNTNDPEVLHQLYLDSLTPEQQLLLPKFRSVSPEAALNFHLDIVRNAAVNNHLKNKELDELDAQLSDLETRIRATYSRYGVGQDGVPEK